MALTLSIRGYQFGRGNHTVYLLSALRRLDPDLLRNDWFTSQTLQYHAVFGLLSGWLLRLGIIETSFLLGYLGLIALMHIAWYRLVHVLGGTRMTYLISVLLYYLSAGGNALGMYTFMQDSALLPSNIANVAMLVGIYFWIKGRFGWSGAWMGVAALFHLNHAVVLTGGWVMLGVWEVRKRPGPKKPLIIGTLLLFIPALINILHAAGAKLGRSGSMPLDEFVDLYVHFRHAHHYDPSSWPVALWICFLWPIPLTFIAWGLAKRLGRMDEAIARAAGVFLLLTALTLVALLGTGLFDVSEMLIQMSLWRFSIYLKLLSCIGAAWLIYNSGLLTRRAVRILLFAAPGVLMVGGLVLLLLDAPQFGRAQQVARFVWEERGAIGLFTILAGALAIYELIYARAHRIAGDVLHGGGIVVLIVILSISWGRWLGVGTVPEDDPEYIRIAHWARDNTPRDAIFLVPPGETGWRLHARRAIVVNFKGVPQLSAELVEYRRRLQRVLDLPDLQSLGDDYLEVMQAMDERYRMLEPQRLFAAAQEFGARFVLATRDLGPEHAHQLVHVSDNGAYFLYDLEAGGNPPGASKTGHRPDATHDHHHPCPRPCRTGRQSLGWLFR